MSCKPKDLSPKPRAYISKRKKKTKKERKERKRKLGMVLHTCTLSTGEEAIGKPLGLTGQPA